MSIAGWLPPQWPKAILPIAIQTDTNSYTPIGTSFLLAFGGFNCLITAKHVVFEDSRPRTGLFILNNVRGGGIMPKSFDSMRTSEDVEWVSHPEKDIAVTIYPINQKMDDLAMFGEELFEDFVNINEGDDIFFLGFPLGITIPSRIKPIVRGGMVSLKRDDDTFLIEANAFPGNSGSPVFFRPCPFQLSPKGLSLGKTRPPKLIGLISQSISYTEAAISRQTGRTRITFEENSGLAMVLSVRHMKETLNAKGFQKMLQAVGERHSPKT